jgi:hypothetical protein
MIQVERGRLSKQIAGDIGIAETTVKVHRSRAMRKMHAHSLVEFGGMADQLLWYLGSRNAPEPPVVRLPCLWCDRTRSGPRSWR